MWIWQGLLQILTDREVEQLATEYAELRKILMRERASSYCHVSNLSHSGQTQPQNIARRATVLAVPLGYLFRRLGL
jgi:hypothetical protein